MFNLPPPDKTEEALRDEARRHLRHEIEVPLSMLEFLTVGDARTARTALTDFRGEAYTVNQLLEALRFTLFSELADLWERKLIERHKARGGRLIPPPPAGPEDCA